MGARREGAGRDRSGTKRGKGGGTRAAPAGGEWVRLAPSSRAGRRTLRRKIRSRERGGRGRRGGAGGGGGGGQASGPAAGPAGAQRGEAASAPPAGRQVRSRPRRPAPPSWPRGSRRPREAAVRAGGAGLAARPNLVRAAWFSSRRTAPGRGAASRGSARPQGSNFAGSRVPPAARRAPSRGGGNGGPLGCARSPRRGAFSPRGRLHLPDLNFPLAPAPGPPEVWPLRARGNGGLGTASRPRRGARGWEGPAPGKRGRCLASNFARILTALPR